MPASCLGSTCRPDARGASRGCWRTCARISAAPASGRRSSDEVPPEVNWDDPENRLALGTGPLAGLPVWGTGGLTVVTRGAMTNGGTSTQANGFFGANLKYCGYDAIVVQGQAPEWVYLLIRGDRVELRDARHLLGKDTWETQDALNADLGCSGHMLSVYSIGPAGYNLVRFAAIQGDYGHVASKNGVGAVMGKKRLRRWRSCEGATRSGPRTRAGSSRRRTTSPTTSGRTPRPRPCTSTAPCRRRRNRGALGALPIKNYTTNVTPAGVDMKQWEAPALRNGFDHRGHQCNACGMHHCHMQVLPSGKYKGQIVDEPEYEGWSGAGWTIGCTVSVAVRRRNTDIVNTRAWWTSTSSVALILAEGTKLAAERLGGGALGDCRHLHRQERLTPRPRPPRALGGDARHLHRLDRHARDGAGGIPAELGLPARINPFDPEQVARQVAALNGRRNFEDSLGACIFTTRTHLENLARTLSAATGWQYSREEAIAAARPPHRRDLPRVQPPLRDRERTGAPVQTLRVDAGRRPGEGAVDREALGPDARPLVRGDGRRPRQRAAHGRDAPGARPRVDGPRGVGRPPVSGTPVATRPITVRVEVLSWVNKLVGGPGTGEEAVDVAVPKGASVRAVLRAISDRYPELGRALWDPTRPRELGDNIEVLVNNAVLGVSHDLDSEVLEGERVTLLGQYMGG